MSYSQPLSASLKNRRWTMSKKISGMSMSLIRTILTPLQAFIGCVQTAFCISSSILSVCYLYTRISFCVRSTYLNEIFRLNTAIVRRSLRRRNNLFKFGAGYLQGMPWNIVRFVKTVAEKTVFLRMEIIFGTILQSFLAL